MKFKLKALVCLLMFFAFVPAGSQSSGAGPLSKVVGVMNSLGSFRANVSIGTAGGGLISGKLAYSRGRVNFRLGDGRVIASNGRMITVFSPASNVAGRQDMGGRGGGLGWILSGFEAKIAGNNAHLTATDPSRSVQEVRMSWTPAYTLRSISIRRGQSQNWLTIRFGNIQKVANIGVSQFSWHPPAGSRTVENPLNQRN